MRSGGIVGVSIIPPVKIRPKEGFIDTKEFDLVIGGDRLDLSKVKTNFEWDLIPFPMMQNTEESQGGYEESDKGQDPPQCCKHTPSKNEEF